MPAVINASIDWAMVADEASYHGVVPQLWWFLQQFDSDAVPAHLRESFHRSFQNNLKHNLILTGELWRIIEMLKAHGISAIPFKGPTLAMLAYGDLAWREFTDLDILVSERDLVKVGELLTSIGYQPRMDLSVLNDPVFVALEREFYFSSARSGTLIDLQWHLSSSILPFDLDMAHISKNQMMVLPGGKQIATLRLEDLLLYLCAHGSRHCWERLGWVADVAGLINLNPQLDWDLALAQARALKCERVLLHGLLLARDLMGARLPPTVEHLASADADSNILANNISRMLAQPLGSAMSKFNLHRYFLKLQPQPADQFRHLLRLIFRPTIIDWEFWPLPNALMFLYPFVRAIRLIAERLPFYHPHKPSN
ncbi:MAG: nucleotidyltransferase family protein [Acidobacteriota bacterium]|nr:nucleotidyltransferase family protein [Acidobacteriota bacterium]